MIQRRAIPGGFQGEPLTPQAGAEASKVSSAKHPRLRVVLGSAQDCSPDPDRRHGPNADRNPATEVVDGTLAGRHTLVVDDEPMILEILAEYCASLRMEVREASDGEDALKQIKAHPGIELLITDVRMPGLDGPALAERALVIQPDMKVIFVTGYATHRSATWPILRKPFDLNELEKALRQALTGESSSLE